MSITKISNTQTENSKHKYDLEERTFQFAKTVRRYIKKLPNSIANIPASHIQLQEAGWEDSKQVIRASGLPREIDILSCGGKLNILSRGVKLAPII